MTRDEVVQEMKRIHGALGALLGALGEIPAPPPKPAPVAQGPRPAPRQGILQNPYEGPIDDVTERSVPLKKGGFGTVFFLHTGAAKFETWNEKQARIAYEAVRNRQKVAIKWEASQNGPYTNYDVKGIRLAPQGVAHG